MKISKAERQAIKKLLWAYEEGNAMDEDELCPLCNVADNCCSNCLWLKIDGVYCPTGIVDYKYELPAYPEGTERLLRWLAQSRKRKNE
jgi:hypothetical protein